MLQYVVAPIISFVRAKKALPRTARKNNDSTTTKASNTKHKTSHNNNTALTVQYYDTTRYHTEHTLIAMSLAASRRQGDGPRRVSYSETRVSSSRLYDDSDEEEEDEERQLMREEEEEKALSKKFGEAEEGGESRKRKKEESEKDIAQELDQEEKKKLRKVRPQLLPVHLTGADGLMKLPIEFKKIKYKPKKGKKRDVVAAAAYTQNLVNAYHSFCEDLFPSLAFEDVLLKIEQLGSKKEVKDFLQYTRDNVRNDHVERLYGREKAERMLQELDDGLKLSEEGYEDHYDEVQQAAVADGLVINSWPEGMSDGQGNNNENNTPAATMDNDTVVDPANVATPTNAAGGTTPGAAVMSDDEEQEATFDDDNMNGNADLVTAKAAENLTLTVTKVRKNRIVDSDDEDEEEATFDDVVQADVQAQEPESATAEKVAAPEEETALKDDVEKVEELADVDAAQDDENQISSEDDELVIDTAEVAEVDTMGSGGGNIAADSAQDKEMSALEANTEEFVTQQDETVEDAATEEFQSVDNAANRQQSEAENLTENLQDTIDDK